MKTQTSMVPVRLDAETQRSATAALAEMGLTAKDAMRSLFHRIPVDPMTWSRRARRDTPVRTRSLRSLKKPAANKRANQPCRLDFVRERLMRSGWHDLSLLKSVMLILIANGAPFGPEQKNPALLKGSWAPCRECHRGGAFLRIYHFDDTEGPSGSGYFAPSSAPELHCSNDYREEHRFRLDPLRPGYPHKPIQRAWMRQMQELA